MLIKTLVTLIFILARVHGVKYQWFQAIVHLYVGGLFAAAATYYKIRRKHPEIVSKRTILNLLTLGLVASAVELACFLIGV